MHFPCAQRAADELTVNNTGNISINKWKTRGQ